MSRTSSRWPEDGRRQSRNRVLGHRFWRSGAGSEHTGFLSLVGGWQSIVAGQSGGAASAATGLSVDTGAGFAAVPPQATRKRTIHMRFMGTSYE